MKTKHTARGVGTRIAWRDEDGEVTEGEIIASELKYHARLGMDLTHVTVRWDDGLDDTQHTLESLANDDRVRFL